MGILDMILLFILAAAVIGGLWNGAARVTIGLVATVAGLICATWFYGNAGAFLLPYVNHPGFANIVGFLLIFVGFQIAGAALSWIIGMALKKSGLSWLNRVAGGGVGFVQGVAVAVILVMAIMSFAKDGPPNFVVRSRVAPFVLKAADFLVKLAPNEMRSGFEASYVRAKGIWSKTLESGIRSISKPVEQ